MDVPFDVAPSNEAFPFEAPRRGFTFDPDDGTGPYLCGEVRGFREALAAADDPRATVPQRLVVMVPDRSMQDFLVRWSEDDRYVRRTITIARLFDEKQITAVVTLSSFGYGIDSSLAVESVAPTSGDEDALFCRSGVHPKATVEALLGRPLAPR
jgi:hypothetical protein